MRELIFALFAIMALIAADMQYGRGATPKPQPTPTIEPLRIVAAPALLFDAKTLASLCDRIYKDGYAHAFTQPYSGTTAALLIRLTDGRTGDVHCERTGAGQYTVRINVYPLGEHY